MKLTQFQLQEISKYWFDLSKLTFASLILKFFEPNLSGPFQGSTGTIAIGLTATLAFAILGLIFSKGVRK